MPVRKRRVKAGKGVCGLNQPKSTVSRDDADSLSERRGEKGEQQCGVR